MEALDGFVPRLVVAGPRPEKLVYHDARVARFNDARIPRPRGVDGIGSGRLCVRQARQGRVGDPLASLAAPLRELRRGHVSGGDERVDVRQHMAFDVRPVVRRISRDVAARRVIAERDLRHGANRQTRVPRLRELQLVPPRFQQQHGLVRARLGVPAPHEFPVVVERRLRRMARNAEEHPPVARVVKREGRIRLADPRNRLQHRHKIVEDLQLAILRGPPRRTGPDDLTAGP